MYGTFERLIGMCNLLCQFHFSCLVMNVILIKITFIVFIVSWLLYNNDSSSNMRSTQAVNLGFFVNICTSVCELGKLMMWVSPCSMQATLTGKKIGVNAYINMPGMTLILSYFPNGPSLYNHLTQRWWSHWQRSTIVCSQLDYVAVGVNTAMPKGERAF